MEEVLMDGRTIVKHGGLFLLEYDISLGIIYELAYA